jgi:Flp pilus assembly protein TadG
MMLLIYLGVFYLSRGMRAAQRVDLVAHVIADLAGQQLTGGAGNGQAALADADFTQIFMAATVLLSPMPTTSLQIYGNRRPPLIRPTSTGRILIRVERRATHWVAASRRVRFLHRTYLP